MVTREQFIAHADRLIGRIKQRGVNPTQSVGMDMMRENALQKFDDGECVVFVGRQFTRAVNVEE